MRGVFGGHIGRGRAKAWIALATLASGVAVAPVAAQAVPLTEEGARESFTRIARNGGYWATSNAAYYTEASGEPTEYRMSFTAAADGYSDSGCMWGDPAPPGATPFWRFFHAWDPTTSSVLLYQSSPWGGIAIGKETGWAPGGTESIQVMHAPGAEDTSVRHLNRAVHADTLDSRSFGGPVGTDGTVSTWAPQRAYTWVWRASSDVIPC